MDRGGGGHTQFLLPINFSPWWLWKSRLWWWHSPFWYHSCKKAKPKMCTPCNRKLTIKKPIAHSQNWPATYQMFLLYSSIITSRDILAAVGLLSCSIVYIKLWSVWKPRYAYFFKNLISAPKKIGEGSFHKKKYNLLRSFCCSCVLHLCFLYQSQYECTKSAERSTQEKQRSGSPRVKKLHNICIFADEMNFIWLNAIQ